MYVDISLAHKTSLYVDIEFQTIQDTGVYGHKHQTYLYVDVELQTIKYPNINNRLVSKWT